MHYIRFLKQPRLIPTAGTPKPNAKAPNHALALALAPAAVSAKITITTDLGEFFLFETLQLCASLVLVDDRDADAAGEWITLGSTDLEWTASDGYTGLDVTITMPAARKAGTAGTGTLRMMIQPKKHEHKRDEFADFHAEKQGGVVSVRSMAIDLPERKSTISPPLAERVFVTAGKEIHIWEETGESIARHIWDAGLVLSSYIASLCPSSARSRNQKSSASVASSSPTLPLFTSLLQKPALKVLELGAGCGIVGITLSHLYPNNTQTILTDLPEASSILSQNISCSALPHLSSCILDWSLPLPPNISSETWDLVLVADCTYNPDVVPDLVRTLKSIVAQREECMVVLAMKVRHVSELVFFDLMRESGFVVRERARIPLLVLGQEDEEVEMLGFGFGGVSDGGT